MSLAHPISGAPGRDVRGRTRPGASGGRRERLPRALLLLLRHSGLCSQPLPALSMVLLWRFHCCLWESWNKTHLVGEKNKLKISGVSSSGLLELYPEHQAGSAVMQSSASMPGGICGHHLSRKSCPIAHPRENPPCWALTAQPALAHSGAAWSRNHLSIFEIL